MRRGDTDVKTNKIKVTVTEWFNTNWGLVAELAFYGEEVVDTPDTPDTGDNAVFAVVFAVVAILGMAVVVTKKVSA